MLELNKRDPPLEGDNMPGAVKETSSEGWDPFSWLVARPWTVLVPKWPRRPGAVSRRSGRIDE